MTARAFGRPTWAEIDLAALKWNFRQVRKQLAAATRVLAVVKADAYGHGALACSQTLIKSGADALGVACVEEALELRQAGLNCPIVIFGLIRPDEAEAVLQADLQPTLILKETAVALARAARRAKKLLYVHLKVDTGMGRIGLSPADAVVWLQQLANYLPWIQLAGIYTHFAHADGRNQRLLRQQQQSLVTVVNQARLLGWQNFLAHASNSAAILESRLTHLDMVRPGLMLYGLYPAPRFNAQTSLKPVLQWKTRIIQLKKVPKGTGLSYGHSYVTRKTSTIATLPVGYADGFARSLSNQGEVLIGGKVCPVVGRVCMDMCLVDVTRLAHSRVGDEVVILGRQGRGQLTAEQMAEKRGTIAYEVVCNISKRVPRRYVGGAG